MNFSESSQTWGRRQWQTRLLRAGLAVAATVLVVAVAFQCLMIWIAGLQTEPGHWAEMAYGRLFWGMLGALVAGGLVGGLVCRVRAGAQDARWSFGLYLLMIALLALAGIVRDGWHWTAAVSLAALVLPGMLLVGARRQLV